jgi:colicin import membrane protein
MKAMQVTCAALVAAGLCVGIVLAGPDAPRTAATKAAAERAVFGGPFYSLKGLSPEVRRQLATLWAEAKAKAAAARTEADQALKTYETQGEALLNEAQKEELKAFRAAREERMKQPRTRPSTAAETTPRPAARVVGPLADLKDLTEEQAKKVSELVAARESAAKTARDEMQKAVAAADKAYEEALDKVLSDGQKAALKAAAETAKAQREAAAKRADEERRKRQFGGDFTTVKTLTDDQRLALARLWQAAQEVQAAAAKAAKDADQEYVEKGKKLLTPEQLKALEEAMKPKSPAAGAKP